MKHVWLTSIAISTLLTTAGAGFAQDRREPDPGEIAAGAVLGGILGGVVEGPELRRERRLERLRRERYFRLYGRPEPIGPGPRGFGPGPGGPGFRDDGFEGRPGEGRPGEGRPGEARAVGCRAGERLGLRTVAPRRDDVRHRQTKVSNGTARVGAAGRGRVSVPGSLLRVKGLARMET